MLSEKKIKEIIEDCKSKGYDIKVRDIAFFILKNNLSEEIAFKCLFYSDDIQYEKYIDSPNVVFLDSYWRFNVEPFLEEIKAEDNSITAEDNKAAMEKLIKDLTRSIDNDEYTDEKSKITAQKTVADLRIKLSEKFNINDSTKSQVVQVEQKYNSVCSYCHREIAVPTKKELMKQYNLVEKN